MYDLITTSELITALGLTTRDQFKTLERHLPVADRAGRGGEKRWRIEVLPELITHKREALAIRETARRYILAREAAKCLLDDQEGAAVPLPAKERIDNANEENNGGANADVSECAELPATVGTDGKEHFTSHQRRVDRARAVIFKAIQDYGGSEVAAIRWINEGVRAGVLPKPLILAIGQARDKESGVRSDEHITRNTLSKWKKHFKKHGHYAPLPTRRKDLSVKSWHGLAIALRQRPQGTSITWIHEQLSERWSPGWGKPIGEHPVRDFFNEKFSAIDQLKGRHSGSALRSKLFFTKRNSAGLDPWDEIHADGWKTHFTAPHPVSREFVTYEVWHFHDVSTRYVTPFGVGLTENFEVIAKGLENCVREGGVMLILQTDSTKIVKGSERFSGNVVTAIEERLGTTIRHPQTVGNAQANGISENFNAYLDREAKELATYQGKYMDSLTLKRVKKITEKMVKADKANNPELRDQLKGEAEKQGKGLVFTSFDQALAWLEEKRQKFNNKPHSSLTKISDPNTGRKRHMTPAEALQKACAGGWEPLAVSEAELIEIFRPHVIKKVSRGTVTPYGGMRYRHTELDNYLGKEVIVAYDFMNWSGVQVKDIDGSLICEARFVETTGYRPESAYESAEKKRAAAQIKRREKQIAQISERQPMAALDGTFSHMKGQKFEKVPIPQPDCMPEVPDEPAKEKEVMSHQDLVMLLYGNPVKEDEKLSEKTAD